ncbi:hypothetical protein BJ742DRAFT_744780 [Cladochytrium replicatum]|nr:hypothetical protein BJ742DRAFT_744780 [Cladochytrium replicatum]
MSKLDMKEESVELGDDPNQASSSTYTDPFCATSPEDEAREDSDRGQQRDQRGKQPKVDITDEYLEARDEPTTTSTSTYTDPFHAASPLDKAKNYASGSGRSKDNGKQPTSGTAYLQ